MKCKVASKVIAASMAVAMVDRPEVEVQQCMQLTGTNSPRA